MAKKLRISKNIILFGVIGVAVLAYFFYKPSEPFTSSSRCSTLIKAEKKARDVAAKVKSLASSAKNKADIALNFAVKAGEKMEKVQAELNKAVVKARAAEEKAVKAVTDAEIALNKLIDAGNKKVAECMGSSGPTF